MLPAAAPKPQQQRRQRKQPQAPPTNVGAMMTRFRHREILDSVEFTADGTTVHQGLHFDINGKAPVLKKMSSIYDSYRIFGVKYFFVSSMSKNTDGTIVLAVDPGTARYPTTFKDTLSVNPHVTGPIHEKLAITVPKIWCNSMLLREMGSANATPFQLIVSLIMKKQTKGTVVGYIEIEYDIELTGLTP
jgi:hypothetical protein